MPDMYKCFACGKQNEVAFIVSPRNPSKISRATPASPKPMCFTCAEAKRKALMAEALAEPKPKKRDKTQTGQTETKHKVDISVSDSETDAVVLNGDIDLIWRWLAYGTKWTKTKPSTEGHYWVWAEKVGDPICIHLSDLDTGKYVPTHFAGGGELWFLGPIHTPPSPRVAAAKAAKAAKKKEVAS